MVAAGLITHFVGSGPIADLAGDTLYAVMIYLFIGIAFPRAAFWVVGVTALTLCTLIECLQLTGLPGLWAESFWPVRLVLGIGFDARDLAAYARAPASRPSSTPRSAVVAGHAPDGQRKTPRAVLGGSCCLWT